MTNDTCSICLESLFHYGADGLMEPIGSAMCGHCFHCDCFWRWEQSKSAQNWRQARYNAPCPCPVCNLPVLEFVRLYITGDTNEAARLRKELKIVTKKMEKEHLRRQQAEHKLQAATAGRLTRKSDRAISAPRARQGTSDPPPSSSPLTACGSMEDDDMLDILNTVIQLLSSSTTSPPGTSPRPSSTTTSPTPTAIISNPRRIEAYRAVSPSYRRLESSPATMRASTSSGRNGAQPSGPRMSSSSPTPRNVSRTSRRSPPVSCTTDAIHCRNIHCAPREDAPMTCCNANNSRRAPRLDPPSRYPSRSNFSLPAVLLDHDTPDDVSSLPSLSSLLWFEDNDPPSCHVTQQRHSRGHSLTCDPPPV